jgi:hypothetical protein
MEIEINRGTKKMIGKDAIQKSNLVSFAHFFFNSLLQATVLR